MRLLGLHVGKLPPSLRPSYFCVESCANDKKIWSGSFSAYILLIRVLTELRNFIAQGPVRLREKHSHLVGLPCFQPANGACYDTL